jgi:HD-GYP domain-containing protein (c-di-GMP phosphodiesterase class II)
VRIVAICDVYAGMISNRGYRQSCCPFQIIALFEKDGLHKYDTDYTILFLRSMLDTYVGYSVVLNTGEQGIITSVNPYNLSNPVITINGMTVNLALDDSRNILHIL